MKLQQTFVGTLYKKKESEYTAKDGSKAISKKLIIDQNDNVGEMSAIPDVYASVKAGSEYIFTTIYNSEKGYLSITSAVLKDVADAKAHR